MIFHSYKISKKLKGSSTGYKVLKLSAHTNVVYLESSKFNLKDMSPYGMSSG